jgi:hypothetical protein
VKQYNLKEQIKAVFKKIPFVQIFRIIIFMLASVSMFFYFFSFIGILAGIGFLLISRDRSWKVNGAVLAFCTALSTWVANTGIELAPLKLAAATGPPLLILFVILKFTFKELKKKGRLPVFAQKFKDIKWKPFTRRIAVIIVIVLPIYMWESVSMDYGVLFNNSPQLLWVNVPTTVSRGEDFKITVQAWDPYERLSALYKGTVSFELESYDLATLEPVCSPEAILPGPYTFTGQNSGSSMAYSIRDGKDNGKKTFGASIQTAGIHYIKVTDSQSKKTYYSNPVVVGGCAENEYRIYWGDIHTHSKLSDGSGSLDHNYYYGREIAGLDFMAVTDHAEILMWQPGIFNLIEKKVNMLNDPGNFVIFQGVEWTQVANGHYTMIFSGDKLLKHVNYLNTPKPYDLWKRLDEFTQKTGTSALALPHHSTKKEYIQDWTYLNPKYVKIAEVASTHGNFLFEPWHELNYEGSVNPPLRPQNGTSIIDAILMGHRLGLYASSDTHDGFPGHTLSHTKAYMGHQRPFTIWNARNEKPYAGGLTAVYAASLSREEVFNGLYSQRIYASNDYGRPYLDLIINGTKFIDSNKLTLETSQDERTLEIIFAQDGAYTPQKQQEPINGKNWYIDWNANIEILKNGKLWHSVSTSNPVVKIIITDDDEITGAEYGFDKCIMMCGNYYINEYSDQSVNPLDLNTKGEDFYIIRTVSAQGRESYIGPFWVSSN